MNSINPRFFDLEIYAIYKAVNEVMGEDTWRIVWRAGEILIEEVWEEAGLSSTENVFEALETLGTWLSRQGYVDNIEFRRVDEDTFEYIMSDPVITPGAKRLIEMGMVPPHISTSAMFALLKRFGYSAEMIGDPVFMDDGRVLERWRIHSREEQR